MISSHGAPPPYSFYKGVTNPLADTITEGFSPRALLAVETWPDRAEPPYRRCVSCVHGSLSPPILLIASIWGPIRPLHGPLSTRQSREMDQLDRAADRGDGGQPPKKAKRTQAQIDSLKRARGKRKRGGGRTKGSGISLRIDGADRKSGSYDFAESAAAVGVERPNSQAIKSRQPPLPHLRLRPLRPRRRTT